MTGMSDAAWQRTREVGAHVSLFVPIEMQMRHGMPPIRKAPDLGITRAALSEYLQRST
ncbi:hypothetical protein [Salipiger sp.]|uniref:hypothetical protein n=1 Tax=Salipiger sp. TaxID=2078585 RepID=UPI003A96AA52